MVAVVAAVSHAGVAQAVAGGMQRAVCRIGGGSSCGAAPAGGRNGPELPGAPGGGPAFGSIPYVRPGVSWDGSVEVEGKGGVTVKQGPFSGGAWVKAQIERECTACRLDENGRAVVNLRSRARSRPAGSDIAQGLARLSNPVDIMNYLNQQVARGNAAGFVENVERFVQDSRAEGRTGHGFPAGAKFTAPQC